MPYNQLFKDFKCVDPAGTAKQTPIFVSLQRNETLLKMSNDIILQISFAA
jgi:hypothetical protein